MAAKHLNRHLRKSLEESPELLTRLHAAFEAADDTGDGLIRQEKWLAAFEAVGMSQPPDEILEDREEDGSPWALSYYEFLAHALGLKASVVELVLYDLSQGVAQWIPGSLLGGHQLDGIWHSGLRVFGKEFWFGGVILESKYEDVPFGVPKQVIRLGTTLRTYEDMVEFLKEDLYVDYNPRSYDVLRRNCNHFANELAQFLLHGKQLPDDVLMQPEWVQDAMLVRFLRPVLNRWLGGFGDALNAGGADELPQAVSRVDDLTEEWRCRLQPGDVVMHRHRFIDRPRAVRLPVYRDRRKRPSHSSDPMFETNGGRGIVALVLGNGPPNGGSLKAVLSHLGGRPWSSTHPPGRTGDQARASAQGVAETTGYSNPCCMHEGSRAQTGGGLCLVAHFDAEGLRCLPVYDIKLLHGLAVRAMQCYTLSGLPPKCQQPSWRWFVRGRSLARVGSSPPR